MIEKGPDPSSLLNKIYCFQRFDVFKQGLSIVYCTYCFLNVYAVNGKNAYKGWGVCLLRILWDPSNRFICIFAISSTAVYVCFWILLKKFYLCAYLPTQIDKDLGRVRSGFDPA